MIQFFKKFVFKVLQSMQQGELTVRLPDGSLHHFGNAEMSDIKAEINIKNEVFFKKVVLNGDIGLGESYMDDDWDTPSITQVIQWLTINIDNLDYAIMTENGKQKKNRLLNSMKILNLIQHRLNKNSMSGSRQNIQRHYDLSNDFYQHMLDDTMTYSCGIFEHPENDLKDAQHNKYEALCQSMELKPTDKVLEIGCGWGGFAIYAVEKYQCSVHSITISQAQYQFVAEKIQHLNLQDKITLELIDYRNLTGQYDKIVSIEMIEAVGHQFLHGYFKIINQCLKKQGILAIQAITSPDGRYHDYRKNVDWIQKYIFPGGLLPSVGIIQDKINKVSQLQLYKMQDFGPHYASTLRAWLKNFEKNIEQIRKMGFDQTFIRKWKYYLCACEAMFMTRDVSVVQMTFVRPNNLALSDNQIG